MADKTLAHARPKPVKTSDNSETETVEFTRNDLHKLEDIFRFWSGLNSLFDEVGFCEIAAPTLTWVTNPANDIFDRFFKDIYSRFPKEGE